MKKINFKKKGSLVGSAFVIIAGMLWGLTGIFVRYFTELGLSSMQIAVFKITFAGFFMLLYCLLFNRKALKIKLKDIWIFACQGLISLDFFTVCYFTTIQKTSLSVAAVLLYLAPVVVMLLSALIFKEKITPKKIIACMLAVLGCFFVSGLIGGGQSIPLIALATGVLSAIGYGLYSIFGEFAIRRGYSAVTITTYTFMFAIVGLIFIVEPTEIASAISKTNAFEFVIMAIVTSVVVSLLPYIFYTNGLARVSPSKASIMASIEPITATIVGFLVFNETIDVFGFIGIELVVAAIVILNAKKFSKTFFKKRNGDN